MTDPTRILLADDDDLFRESLAHNLIDAGFTVIEAESGAAALARLAEEPRPALMLLDWKMPGMNGIEVLRRMRDGDDALPVIFLTALSNQIYEEAALQGGAVDFVEKTRSFGILLKRINLIVAGLKGTAAAGTTGDLGTTAEAGRDDVLRVGALELRRDSHRAFWRGGEASLSVTEFKMVELLAGEPGRDAAYRELYDLVHGEGFVAGGGEEGYRGNVRAFMKRIRRKFRALDENFDEIESYSGFGYRWRRPRGGDA